MRVFGSTLKKKVDIYIEMPRKSQKSRKVRKTKTRRQKVVNMIGCSKKHKHNKTCKKNIFSSLAKRFGLQRAGSGCGSCGCPIPPLSWKQMNSFGGSSQYPPNYVKMAGTSAPLNYGPILGASGQVGGHCGQCVQSGGSFYKPAAPIPGPFVGSAWGAPINQWPGVNGVSGDRNFLTNYDNNTNDIVGKDPALQMTMNDAGYQTLNSKVGGKHVRKSRSHSKKTSGGGLVPQDLVNLGNSVSYNFKSAYNGINGYAAPVNPLPYKDQMSDALSNNRIII